VWEQRKSEGDRIRNVLESGFEEAVPGYIILDACGFRGV
jgi:hypothetical protein